MKPEPFTLDTLLAAYPRRAPDARKGDGGVVLVIGGSKEFHGAPIMAGLAALRSGADLVVMAVPKVHAEVTKQASPQFIVRDYAGDYFQDPTLYIELAQQCSAALIGPGLNKHSDTLSAVMEFLKQTTLPVVLDADAIIEAPLYTPRTNWLFTPHRGELKRMQGGELNDSGDALIALAAQLNAHILLKGPTDLIAAPDGRINSDPMGDPSLTKGGTGDTLAGFVTGLIGQGMPIYEAAGLGARVIGDAGQRLAKELGNGYIIDGLQRWMAIVLREYLS